MSGLIHSHSGLRWIILAGLLIVIFNSFSGKKSGRDFTDKDRKLGLIAFIGSHIQLILGIILYVKSSKVSFDNTMVNAMFRFFTVEHTLGMIIGITLITLGYMQSKKATDSKTKFSKQFNYYLIALIIILASIPWPFREALGGSWF